MTTRTMNKEVGRRWVKALRSGEYEQGKRRLTQINFDGEAKHCCLGVLCDLAVKDDDIEVSVLTTTGGDLLYDDRASYLPLTVAEWAGLEETNVAVKHDGYNTTLAHLNDALGLTFDRIADVIEANFDLTPEPGSALPVLPDNGYLPLVEGEKVILSVGPMQTRDDVTVIAVTEEMVRVEGEAGVHDVLRSHIHTVMRNKVQP